MEASRQWKPMLMLKLHGGSSMDAALFDDMCTRYTTDIWMDMEGCACSCHACWDPNACMMKGCAGSDPVTAALSEGSGPEQQVHGIVWSRFDNAFAASCHT